jgi:asparagine synthase (glutamine-hydrolysing)
MCGIVGLLHHDPAHPVDRSQLLRMSDAIRHRGPDDAGLHLDGPVGLAMRRLAIIDVAGGHQPILNEDRSAAIVLNGEIYNYRPLQQALRARGHRFGSTGDTETVLHLYEEEGEECVTQLRGMFAFAIWDQRRGHLFLARDRFGIKPLYYHLAPWGIAFASELKALLAAGCSDGALDWEGLDAFLELGYLPAPFTPFVDIRKLMPGHTLTWSPGALPSIRRYWDLPRQQVVAPPGLPQRVREWIDDSVAAHLVSDVPVAAFLSGGLDSSAVVASMARQGTPPDAFTVRYGGTGAESADETPLAGALAERYGVRLNVVDVHPALDEILEPIAWALDEPLADDSVIPTWHLSQAVGARYKVVLTGIGGDELFAGYRRHLALRWSGLYGALPALLRGGISALAERIGEPRTGGLGVDRLKRFVRIGDGDDAQRFLAMVRRLPARERAALATASVTGGGAGDAAERIFRAHHDQAGRPSGVGAGLYLDYKTFLPDDILALSDRISMAHGLEVRVPFVDHRLVESVFPLPDRAKVGWGRAKALLRRALAPQLPSAHLRAPKRGFVGPMASWLRHELRPMLMDELSPSRLARLGHFDPQIVERLLLEHDRGQQNRETILWALLTFSLWHRLYCEEGLRTSTAPLTAGRAVAPTPR